MKDKVCFEPDFDYEKMILEGWTNAGLIEAGYVTKKNKIMKNYQELEKLVIEWAHEKELWKSHSPSAGTQNLRRMR
jgi:hypothetical protein